MTLEAATQGGETELATVRTLGAQIKAGGAQPTSHDVFPTMASLEDSKRLRFKVPTVVLRYGEKIVLDLPNALAAEARCADIAA
jgi:hypothetical protein